MLSATTDALSYLSIIQSMQNLSGEANEVDEPGQKDLWTGGTLSRGLIELVRKPRVLVVHDHCVGGLIGGQPNSELGDELTSFALFGGGYPPIPCESCPKNSSLLMTPTPV